MLKKNIYALLVFFLILIAFVILFLSRAYDDNRLTSWQWVFSVANGLTVYLLLIPGISTAYILARSSLPKRAESPTLLFCISFLFASCFWSEPEVIVDASRYFTQAKYLATYGIDFFIHEWGKSITAWTDLPLIPFLYGLIFKYGGESRILILFFNTLLFSATVVVTSLIGKSLWDESTGWVGGILLLGIPYLFTQVPLMLVDVPTMFFVMLSVYAFLRALDRGGPVRILLASVLTGLAFLSKYSAWPMLAIVFFSILFSFSLRLRPPNGQHAKAVYLHRGLAILSLTLILLGTIMILKYDSFSEQIRLLLSYQKPGLGRWKEGFLSTFCFQIHPFITIAAVFSLYVAFKRRDATYLIISTLVIAAVLFQVKRIRYLLPLFPMITLMASYGLQRIQDGTLRRFIVLSIICSSFIIAAFGYLPFTKSMSAINLKEAGAFLNTIDEESIEFFVLSQENAMINQAVSVPLLDLFTSKRIVYRYDLSALPPPEMIENSPLRFSWEYRNPEYYEGNNDGTVADRAVVIITDDTGTPVPENVSSRLKAFRVVKEFKKDEGVFQYKTFVTVYRREA